MLVSAAAAQWAVGEWLAHANIDVRLPGMLTAVMARPPVFGGKVGKVGKVDSARQLANYRALAKKTGAIFLNANISALATAPKKISAEFVFPYLVHAPMEPLNCTVQVSGQGANAKAELWVGTQMPGIDALAAAKVLGLQPHNVIMHVQMAGGGFGRRAILSSEFVFEACSVAKAARTAGLDAAVRTLPGAAITLKDGVVEQSNFGDFPAPRITGMPLMAVIILPSADAPTGLGEPGLPPLAPAFANAIAVLTGKTLPELPFKLTSPVWSERHRGCRCVASSPAFATHSHVCCRSGQWRRRKFGCNALG
jgi:CO/xanthine dehydrogenase Mo-binding subunit